MNADIAAGAFWLVEGFWPMVGVLAAFAAASTLAIAGGPAEIPYDQEQGEDEL